ncbi:MAG: hypothetical protein Q4P71_07825 [Actinomycetaceae bacterium]|nr:hypothetical protein [Actinomycetaceae bacterium]
MAEAPCGSKKNWPPQIVLNPSTASLNTNYEGWSDTNVFGALDEVSDLGTGVGALEVATAGHQLSAFSLEELNDCSLTFDILAVSQHGHLSNHLHTQATWHEIEEKTGEFSKANLFECVIAGDLRLVVFRLRMA